MSQVTLTRDDLERLARRLNELADTLDDRDQLMLLALFALGEETLTAGGDDEVEGFVAPRDITFTKQVDVASPALFQTSLSDSSGGDRPVESLTLNFGQIAFTYQTQ